MLAARRREDGAVSGLRVGSGLTFCGFTEGVRLASRRVGVPVDDVVCADSGPVLGRFKRPIVAFFDSSASCEMQGPVLGHDRRAMRRRLFCHAEVFVDVSQPENNDGLLERELGSLGSAVCVAMRVALESVRRRGRGTCAVLGSESGRCVGIGEDHRVALPVSPASTLSRIRATHDEECIGDTCEVSADPEKMRRVLHLDGVVHAEIDALSKCREDPSWCVVSRLPCPSCLMALVSRNVLHVVYFEPDPNPDVLALANGVSGFTLRPFTGAVYDLEKCAEL